MHCGGDHALPKVGEMDIFGKFLGLGLGLITGQKKRGLPSPRAEAGQGNIERVHEPKPIQTIGLL
jgi:hypothetical protein